MGQDTVCRGALGTAGIGGPRCLCSQTPAICSYSHTEPQERQPRPLGKVGVTTGVSQITPLKLGEGHHFTISRVSSKNKLSEDPYPNFLLHCSRLHPRRHPDVRGGSTPQPGWNPAPSSSSCSLDNCPERGLPPTVTAMTAPHLNLPICRMGPPGSLDLWGGSLSSEARGRGPEAGLAGNKEAALPLCEPASFLQL